MKVPTKSYQSGKGSHNWVSRAGEGSRGSRGFFEDAGAETTSGIVAACRATAQEGSNLMAIAAKGHGAPAAPVRAGIIVKEEAAGRVGAAADRRAGAFDEEFGGRAGNCGEKPVQATFASHELQRPGSFVGNKLVVALGNAQDLVDGLDPGGGEGFTVDDGSEHRTERFAKTQNAEENGIHGLSLGGKKRTEATGTILGDQARIDKEGNEFVPGQIVGRGSQVGKIKGEAAGNPCGSSLVHQKEPNSGGSGITCFIAMVGYTMRGSCRGQRFLR